MSSVLDRFFHFGVVAVSRFFRMAGDFHFEKLAGRGFAGVRKMLVVSGMFLVGKTQWI